MNDLLALTIEAHGGFENWNKINKISARIFSDGLVWERRQQPGIMHDVEVTVDTRIQRTQLRPYYDPQVQINFEANRMTLENRSGQIIEDLWNPRQSFDPERIPTWSRLQAFYFIGYAMWNYLNEPFYFADPAYKTSEIEPWEENGEVWRRLRVVFPEGAATHSTIQTFYIDKSGLFRRHDYNVEISGGAAAAHYLYDYVEVEGIKIPSQRRVYIRNEDNTSAQSLPVLINMHLDEIQLF